MQVCINCRARTARCVRPVAHLMIFASTHNPEPSHNTQQGTNLKHATPDDNRQYVVTRPGSTYHPFARSTTTRLARPCFHRRSAGGRLRLDSADLVYKDYIRTMDDRRPFEGCDETVVPRLKMKGVCGARDALSSALVSQLWDCGITWLTRWRDMASACWF